MPEYTRSMKNIIIVALLILVTGLGYIVFTRDTKSPIITSTQSSQKNTDEPVKGDVLNLSNKNLSEVSKDILDDSSIVTLDVSGNNLTGSLPGEIRKLTNLEVLDASDNSMTGVPAEIGQLMKLRTINFANNKLSGLPMEIGNLKNLETLDLRGNPNVSRQDIDNIKKSLTNTEILTD